MPAVKRLSRDAGGEYRSPKRLYLDELAGARIWAAALPRGFAVDGRTTKWTYQC